ARPARRSRPRAPAARRGPRNAATHAAASPRERAAPGRRRRARRGRRAASERGLELEVDLAVDRRAPGTEPISERGASAGGGKLEAEAVAVAVHAIRNVPRRRREARLHQRVVPEQQNEAVAAGAQEPAPLEPRQPVAVDAEF